MNCCPYKQIHKQPSATFSVNGSHDGHLAIRMFVNNCQLQVSSSDVKGCTHIQRTPIRALQRELTSIDAGDTSISAFREIEWEQKRMTHVT